MQHFLTESGIDISKETKNIKKITDKLSTKTWVGNIRELQHEIRYLLLATNNSIPEIVQLIQPLESAQEKQKLLTLLQEHDWNKSKVARVMNVSEGTIRNQIKKYNLFDITEKI